MLTESIPVPTPAPPPASVEAALTLQAGPYFLDITNCLVRTGADQVVPLTRFEMTLLVHLASQPGITVSKDELGRLMYEGKVKPATNSLEVFVGRIRRKIDPDKTRRPIETTRYSGYRFRDDWQAAQ